MLIAKIIKNLKWKRTLNRMKSVGEDNRIGLDFSVHGEKYITIKNHFRGGKHVIIDAIDSYNGKATGLIPEIHIEDNVTFTDNCYISCMNKIHIGKGTLLGPNTFICDNFHGKGVVQETEIMPSKRELYSKGPVLIGENVWIGRNVCVMPGVIIGNNVIVGANSVVTHDIEDNMIVAGVPAKVLKRIE